MRKNNFECVFFWSVNARRVHPRMNGVWRFVDTLWDFLCFDLNIIKMRRSNQNKRVFFWRDLFHHLDYFIMPICCCCCWCYLFTHTTPSHSLYIRIPCNCAFVFLYIGFGKLIPSKDWGGARICMCALFWINIHLVVYFNIQTIVWHLPLNRTISIPCELSFSLFLSFFLSFFPRILLALCFLTYIIIAPHSVVFFCFVLRVFVFTMEKQSILFPVALFFRTFVNELICNLNVFFFSFKARKRWEKNEVKKKLHAIFKLPSAYLPKPVDRLLSSTLNLMLMMYLYCCESCY